jgi:hypothetical protein
MSMVSLPSKSTSHRFFVWPRPQDRLAVYVRSRPFVLAAHPYTVRFPRTSAVGQFAFTWPVEHLRGPGLIKSS